MTNEIEEWAQQLDAPCVLNRSTVTVDVAERGKLTFRSQAPNGVELILENVRGNASHRPRNLVLEGLRTAGCRLVVRAVPGLEELDLGVGDGGLYQSEVVLEIADGCQLKIKNLKARTAIIRGGTLQSAVGCHFVDLTLLGGTIAATDLVTENLFLSDSTRSDMRDRVRVEGKVVSQRLLLKTQDTSISVAGELVMGTIDVDSALLEFLLSHWNGAPTKA